MEGMNCSPFEANAILDTVYEVFSPAMVSDEQQDLGQMYLLCTGIENSSSKPLEKAQMVRVRLTLDGGSEDTQVRRTDGIIALRQHRMERMASSLSTRRAVNTGGFRLPHLQLRHAHADS